MSCDGLDAHAARLERELLAAREREQGLTDLIENAAALHLVDSGGRILWASEAELELLGYTREEYLGRHIGEFHADGAVSADLLRRLGANEALRDYEARLRRKDGSIVHVAIDSDTGRSDSPSAHARCCTHDITARKRHEQRLLAECDADRILANAFSLEAAAPELLRVIGERLEWSAGLFWAYRERENLLCCEARWEDVGKHRAGLAQAPGWLTEESGGSLAGRVWAGKEPEWVSETGLPSAFAFPILFGERVAGVLEFRTEELRRVEPELLGMARSLGKRIGGVLERNGAQQRLAEREERYRILTETAADGILMVNAEGTILYVNAAGAALFGYAVEELTGASLTLLMPEASRAMLETELARYVKSGERQMPRQTMPATAEHRHGYEVPVEVSIGEYGEGERRVLVGVVRDIRERRREDDTLRQTAKLESLGVLAGGVAHDFNNLLTGILGNVSLALEMAGEAYPGRMMLEDAIAASERAAVLTQQLLAYAGKGRFLVEPIDMSAAVREISVLIGSSIPKHVTVRLDLQQPMPLVEADVAQIQQLVMNLVINAAEAIPEEREGTVLVMTRAREIDAGYLDGFGAGDIRPGMYAILSVHDNGTGMDEATMSKIFDPFFTTKFTGRGLGLAAAMGIVQGHRGGLKVFSNPGQGTTFRVLLPATWAGPKQVEAQSGEKDLSGSGTVLVVDDEATVRKTVTASLEKYGYTVVSASNGRDGVTRFRELHQELELVILDLSMPVMNGEEALEQMRRINSNVPVLLSSGYSEMEATRRFGGKRLAGFLQKPYTAVILAQRIQTAIRESRREPGGRD